jgi:hypothetical protein
MNKLTGIFISAYNQAKTYYQNGKLHRTDGPAIENISGLNVSFYTIEDIEKTGRL